MLARHGIADHLMSDNMPFASCEFRAFAKEWRVKLTTSSPTYAPSNGQIERCVSAVKQNVADSRRGRPGCVTSVPQHSRDQNVLFAGSNAEE